MRNEGPESVGARVTKIGDLRTQRLARQEAQQSPQPTKQGFSVDSQVNSGQSPTLLGLAARTRMLPAFIAGPAANDYESVDSQRLQEQTAAMLAGASRSVPSAEETHPHLGKQDIRDGRTLAQGMLLASDYKLMTLPEMQALFSDDQGRVDAA
jgi:hypothetical protein